MKKRILSVLLVGIMLVFAGCGNENVSHKSDTNSVSQIPKETEDKDTEIESEVTQVEETETGNWGVDENSISEKNEIKIRAHIKFPYLCGIVEGTGKIAYQSDNSLVLLGTEVDFNEPEVEGNKLENIFPAYFVKVIGIMEAYRGAGYKDFEFEIASKETLEVNGYLMCKYTGKHTFSSRKENYELDYVAYATKLKGNDAVIYWMVLDETEDQSLGSVIESHADKMAQTLYE